MDNPYSDSPGCSGRARVYFVMGLALGVVLLLWLTADWLEGEARRAKEVREAREAERARAAHQETAPEPVQLVGAGPAFGGAAALVPSTQTVWWVDDDLEPIEGVPALDPDDILVGGRASLLLIGPQGLAVIDSEGDRVRSQPPPGFHTGNERYWLDGLDQDGQPLPADSADYGTLLVVSGLGPQLWTVGPDEVSRTDGALADLLPWGAGPSAVGVPEPRMAAVGSGWAVRTGALASARQGQSVQVSSQVVALDWLPRGDADTRPAPAELIILTGTELCRADPSADSGPGRTTWASSVQIEGTYTDVIAGYSEGQPGGLCRGEQGWRWVALDAEMLTAEAIDVGWPSDGPRPVRLADGSIAGLSVPEGETEPRIEILTRP
ncbi:MAG: hypothetical protein GF320_19975 [Armatimonadia bacterium]|nr:hypothetical protein [Armatimonadia bacterium]